MERFLLVTLHLLDHTPYTEVEVGRFCCFTFLYARHSDTNRMFLSRHSNFATFERSIETSPFEMSNVNKLSCKTFWLKMDAVQMQTADTGQEKRFYVFKKRMFISIKRLFSLCFFHE